MDLSVRLTPPDMLAIECDGGRVSVGSSRASKVTFVADGKTRREPRPGGSFVSARVALVRDTLTFTSTGKAEDNVNVAFESLDAGTRLRVTRRIYAVQLAEPIVIKTIYDKIADRVQWETFDRDQIARRTPPESIRPSRPAEDTTVLTNNIASDKAATLRRALKDWVEATNQIDIERQMYFYMPELQAFYLARNITRTAVKREKIRVFASAKSVDIRAQEPEIIFQDNGRTAVMRFRKEYKVADKMRMRSGEVVQELRWQQIGDDWRISSERDVRVIR